MALLAGKEVMARATGAPLAAAATRAASTWWGGIQQAPEDPILGVSVAFQKDQDPRKINLGVGCVRGCRAAAAAARAGRGRRCWKWR